VTQKMTRGMDTNHWALSSLFFWLESPIGRRCWRNFPARYAKPPNLSPCVLPLFSGKKEEGKKADNRPQASPEPVHPAWPEIMDLSGLATMGGGPTRAVWIRHAFGLTFLKNRRSDAKNLSFRAGGKRTHHVEKADCRPDSKEWGTPVHCPG